MPVFLNPLFLAALAATAIPLALHLLSQRRPRPTPFSTLHFLQVAIAKTRKSRRLTQVLVLLLRCLIILLLALAFARPRLRRADWLPAGPRTVVLVIDASASMRARDLQATSFEKAREWALGLLRSLGEEDRAAVVVLGSASPRLIFPPVSNHALSEQALREMRCGDGRVDLVRELDRLVADLLDEDRADSLELHVFSDFQQTAWDTVAARALGGRLAAAELRCFANRVGPGPVANARVARLELLPEAILGPGDVTVRATIAGNAAAAGANVAVLELDGDEVARRGFTLAGGETTLSLVAPVPARADYATGALRIETDPFEADNSRYFAIERREQLRVLLVNGGLASVAGQADTWYLERALNPMRLENPLIASQSIDFAAFAGTDLAPFQAVLLANPPRLTAGDALKLEDYASGGGSVVLYPGPRGGLRDHYAQVKPLAALELQLQTSPVATDIRLRPSRRPDDLERRILRILGQPPGFPGTQRLLIRRLGPDMQSCFDLDTGSPALVRAPVGRGNIWLSSLAANRAWSEWPLDPSFPIFHQLVAREGFGAQRRTLAVDVGATAPLPWAGEELELNVLVTPPEGPVRRLPLTRRGPRQDFALSIFHQPGLYRLELEAARPETRYVAVNVPAAESDLTAIAEAELAGSLAPAAVFQPHSLAQQRDLIAGMTHGHPLWPWLLLLAFLLGIGEELFANLRSWSQETPQSLKEALRL